LSIITQPPTGRPEKISNGPHQVAGSTGGAGGEKSPDGNDEDFKIENVPFSQAISSMNDMALSLARADMRFELATTYAFRHGDAPPPEWRLGGLGAPSALQRSARIIMEEKLAMKEDAEDDEPDNPVDQKHEAPELDPEGEGSEAIGFGDVDPSELGPTTHWRSAAECFGEAERDDLRREQEGTKKPIEPVYDENGKRVHQWYEVWKSPLTHPIQISYEQRQNCEDWLEKVHEAPGQEPSPAEPHEAITPVTSAPPTNEGPSRGEPAIQGSPDHIDHGEHNTASMAANTQKDPPATESTKKDHSGLPVHLIRFDGHLSTNVSGLPAEAYDGRSYIPDDPEYIPPAPPGARIGDDPEIPRPHPMAIPGQEHHMLLAPDKPIVPNRLSRGKSNKQKLKLTSEKKVQPKLACMFCRQRKIACGVGTGPDKTCKYVVIPEFIVLSN